VPLATSTEDLDEVDAVAKAAGELLPLVLERTGANGDWPRTYAKVVSWGVQACGRAREDLTERIAKAIEGRLEPGVAPSASAAQEVVDDLALEVAVRERPPFCDDALETWWGSTRPKALWGLPSARDARGTEGDAHRLYIRTHDRPGSTKRADAMKRALVRARYGAKKELKLDVALLKEWLELALVSSDVAVRTKDAVSKDEGERYGTPKDLEGRLQQALDEATAEGTAAISRAARVYLDLTFLSPFTDGNARVARLTFDHVLARDGLALHDATPVFSVRRWAHDTGEAWRFQRELVACVGPA